METGDSGRSQRRRQRVNPRTRMFQALPPGRAPVGFVPAISVPPTKAVDNIETESDKSSNPEPAQVAHDDQTEEPLLSIQDKLQRLLLTGSAKTESSTSISPDPQTMSTLGSMARAAEYAAAQSARARQVSRETEEQKLPPKSTPVSLSAFTKGQPTSRNKGNKAWKPLTTDDLGGDEDSSDNLTSCEQTSFYAENDEEPRSTRRLLTKPVYSSNEELKIPTAPKAMLVQRDRPAIVLNPAPRRVSTHSVITYPHHQNLQAPEGTPGRGTQGRSLLNVPQFPYRPSRRQRAAYLHETQFLGPYADQADAMPALSMFGQELHLTAYPTPTRDEIAEVVRERDRQHMLNMANLQPGMNQQQQPAPFGIFDDSPVHYYNPGDYEPTGYAQVQPPSYEITPPGFYPTQQSNMRSDIPNTFHCTPSTYQMPRSATNPPTTLYHPEYRKPDIPYDRARMMEQYKATLVKTALEKKGKTVLHNPDLQKSQGGPLGTPSDSIITSKEPGGQLAKESAIPWSELEIMLDQNKKDREKFEEGVTSTREPSYSAYRPSDLPMQSDVFASNANHPRISLMGPPPGLEMPTDGSGDIKGNGLKEFPDDFYTLKPMTRTEVLKVRQQCQEVRDDLAGTFRQLLHTTQASERARNIAFESDRVRAGLEDSTTKEENINSARATLAEDWFYGPMPVEDTAYCNEVAAMMHECAIKDKALTEKSEQEMAAEKAMISHVMSNVVGNVKYYLEQCKMPEEKRTLTFKVKPVPEYAIEKPSVVTGSLSIFAGFFDDLPIRGAAAEKAFIPTPKRIARDPRFRPAAPKDGGKLTIEEERLARRVEYGRRNV